jgi:hypothetical protein
MALDSETRHASLSYGLLLPFIAKGIDERVWQLSPLRFAVLLVVFAAFAFALSRIWLTIGEDLARFYTFLGPWMRWEPYAVQAAVAALAVIAFAVLLGRAGRGGRVA